MAKLANAYVAVCSCGNVGDDRQTETAARIDANEHEVAAMRRAQAARGPDPRQLELEPAPGGSKGKK